MVLGLALALVALAARAAANTNRHVRGRLIVSTAAFAAYAALAAARAYAPLSSQLSATIAIVNPLLLAFGVINAGVALVVNPWHADRLPERFPTIVQDSIVIGLFAVLAVLVLQDRIYATTAVGAVVIGFALQDTLGNLFSGLAIQIEKPFRVGHWVRVAGVDGMVSEITWRATKVRTKAGNLLIVPNSALARDTIMNYSEPARDTRIEVEVGASYEVPPNEVKATIIAALKDESLITPERDVEVLLADFGPSAIVYHVRAWTTDFSADDRLRDRMRSGVYYAFRRAGITIPYPIQVQIPQSAAAASTEDATVATRVIEQVSIFAALSPEDREQLARAVKHGLYAAGEVVVRQGDEGSSMFVVARGEAAVTIEPRNTEVARIGSGGFFGEMSLLTGAPRNATVRAAVDSEILELTVEAFRRLVLVNPAVVEEIGNAVAQRQSELDVHGAAGDDAAPEPRQRFLDRVRNFLGLSA